MARTEISKTVPSTSGASTNFISADAINGMYFKNTGEELLLVKNDGTAAVTVTVISVPCSHGRTAHEVVTVNVGETKVIGEFEKSLFNQPGTLNVHVDFSAATGVTVAVI